MQYTKKDYKMLSSILKKALVCSPAGDKVSCINIIISDLCEEFTKDNSKFNAQTFINAILK
jgi:hypothetical protein